MSENGYYYRRFHSAEDLEKVVSDLLYEGWNVNAPEADEEETDLYNEVVVDEKLTSTVARLSRNGWHSINWEVVKDDEVLGVSWRVQALKTEFRYLVTAWRPSVGGSMAA